MNEIIKHLRQIRLEKRIAQDTLSLKIGMNENQVSNWENGLYGPSLANAIAWAEALGYEFDLHIKEPANVS